MVYDLTREDWMAAPPNGSYVRLAVPSRPGLETHHTVGLYGAETPGQLARAIQGDHLSRGWTDVFYNVLIWFDGTVVELRPAWAKSGDIEDLTVVFPGNYENIELTDAQMHSWHRVRNWSAALGAGHRVRWHRERCGGCSACPGKNVISWLKGVGFPTSPKDNEEEHDDMKGSGIFKAPDERAWWHIFGGKRFHIPSRTDAEFLAEAGAAHRRDSQGRVAPIPLGGVMIRRYPQA